jgi:DNA-binding response OmpR family regulator
MVMTNPKSVLIVEDDQHLRQTLTGVLRQAGCDVVSAANGTEALQYAATAPYALVYLDIHLPEMNGIQVLKELRRIDPQVPVILFTAHASLQSSLEAMRLGVTDYLLKPVSPAALVARTQAILADQAAQRRRREIEAQIEALQHELKSLIPPAPSATPPLLTDTAAPALIPVGERFLKRGALTLDLQTQRAVLGERMLALTPTMFDYLKVLMRHSPNPVEFQTLVSEAQGYQADLHEAQELARWHVHKLREALEPEPRQPRYILTVRGVGYRLVVD